MSFRLPVFSFIFYVFTVWIVFSVSAKGEDVLARIALANDYYAKTQYRQAAEIYQTLIDEGHKNGYLFYNLGNSFLRLGKLGPSILNYIRAKQFLPRDESLDANMRIAILKTEDQLELPSTNALGSLFFWVNSFTLNEQLVLFGITNLIFWLVLGIWMVRKTALLNLTKKAMMGILLISIISVGVKITLESEITIGVILANKVEIKSARGANNVTLFQLHEGSVVSIIDSQNDWYHIQLNDGKKGWAQKDLIGI
jgi:tetratricopeptide (TPR) repeat protein